MKLQSRCNTQILGPCPIWLLARISYSIWLLAAQYAWIFTIALWSATIESKHILIMVVLKILRFESTMKSASDELFDQFWYQVSTVQMSSITTLTQVRFIMPVFLFIHDLVGLPWAGSDHVRIVCTKSRLAILIWTDNRTNLRFGETSIRLYLGFLEIFGDCKLVHDSGL